MFIFAIYVYTILMVGRVRLVVNVYVDNGECYVGVGECLF